MKSPGIIRVIDVVNNNCTTEINGKWVPARPLPLYSILHRLKATWLVFTGKCDALVWPEDQ